MAGAGRCPQAVKSRLALRELLLAQDTVLTMLEHGKAVLCEKPIGLTGSQAEEMADFAKEMVRRQRRPLCGMAWSGATPVIGSTELRACTQPCAWLTPACRRAACRTAQMKNSYTS